MLLSRSAVACHLLLLLTLAVTLGSTLADSQSSARMAPEVPRDNVVSDGGKGMEGMLSSLILPFWLSSGNATQEQAVSRLLSRLIPTFRATTRLL